MENHVGYYNREEWQQEDGKLHRIDGPAVIYANGHQEYFIHGKHHRGDGPAIIRKSGGVEYYYEGLLHRIDGPAIISCDGSIKYFIHGKELSEKEFNMYHFVENI